MKNLLYSDIELRHFAAIIQSSDDAIISKDLSGKIISWNPGAEKIFGYSREEAVGKNISILLPSDRLNEEGEILSKIKAGETIDHYETIRKTKDGKLLNISLTVSPITNDLGQVIGASKIARDISMLKEAERHNALLASIVESSEDAIVSKTLQGIVTTWNPGAQKIFGYTAAEMIGQPITKIIPQDRLNEEPIIISKITAGEKVEHFDTIRRKKDGTLIDISLTISPIRDLKGKIIGASKIARNITEKKQVERELKEKNEALEKINQELNDFAYIVSHDLKAPLRAIGTLSHFIKEDYQDKIGEDGLEQLNMLVGRVKRMNSLIDGVLQYSKLGRQKERVVEVSIKSLIKEIVSNLNLTESIKITTDEMPSIIIEQVQFTQVLQNLLSNAIKFSDKPEGKIHVGYKELPSYHQFSVQDNGPGIGEKYFDKIFQIFQTLQPRDEFENTGVGLTIVKKAVELKGGQVWLESKVGEGSTFYFTWAKFQS